MCVLCTNETKGKSCCKEPWTLVKQHGSEGKHGIDVGLQWEWVILIKNTPSDTKTRLQVFFDSHSFSSLTIQVSAARTDHTPVLTSDANKMRKRTKSNIYQSACRGHSWCWQNRPAKKCSTYLRDLGQSELSHIGCRGQSVICSPNKRIYLNKYLAISQQWDYLQLSCFTLSFFSNDL